MTRLGFRRARGQRRSEEAVTSLKAYRVEFIGPLTEYAGTENGRGKHQNAIVSAIRFAVELALSLRDWNGQVDTEKLTQRSSVAIG